MFPKFTAHRLAGLAVVTLAVSIFTLVLLPQRAWPLHLCFAVQALVGAGFLMRRAVGNRRRS